MDAMQAMALGAGPEGPPMDSGTLERYADMLDELEKTDPDSYRRLVAAMQQQLQASGSPTPSDADSALLGMLKQSAEAGSHASGFAPKFPGDKVMDAEGLKPKTEGVHIDVQPGFVVKTLDVESKKKVFVNVCHSDAVQTFSQKKQLDDQGKEQEGIHVPLSLGAPHEVTDKKGQRSLAFDVAVNSKVVDDCRQDKTGAFRNFVCELALEYIDQKYKVKLDPRFKLPRLAYAGELPPPRHYIRKSQAPIIQEVSTVESSSTALSREILRGAGERLSAKVFFESVVISGDDVEIELRAEYLAVKAAGHRDFGTFLPYPVVTESASVTLNRGENSLTVSALIDKRWDAQSADQGSAPWLLAQALNDGAEDQDKMVPPLPLPQQSKSLAEMFHLVMPQSDTYEGSSMMQRATQWDPVDEDEELPEDRFHKKDMMSMHILEQRRAERAQKAQEADEKRQQRRAQAEEKQRKAREAGKTWREMYPNEPETTYIDVEDIVREKANARQNPPSDADLTGVYNPTEEAQRAAAAWSEDNAAGGYDIKSAMAFELL